MDIVLKNMDRGLYYTGDTDNMWTNSADKAKKYRWHNLHRFIDFLFLNQRSSVSFKNIMIIRNIGGSE